MTPILDASVFVAAISPTEPHHHRARLLFHSHPDSAPFLVPELFRIGVVAPLTRRGEPPELLEMVDALVRGPRFTACPLDEDLLTQALHVARLARLRAYDAVHVALAITRGEPILSLDEEVIQRSRTAFPDLRVVSVN